LNNKEINNFLSFLKENKEKFDFNEVINQIRNYSFKFSQNDIFEIINALFGKQGFLITPKNIADLIFKIGQFYNPKSIIDICCGSGSLLTNFANYKITKGIDNNIQILEFAKFLNTNTEFIFADTLEYDFGDEKFDLVLGNLPFGAKTQQKKQLEVELVKKGLNLLSDNGTAIFVVPEGFLSSQNLMDFRDSLLTNYAFDIIVSLPIETFYPFSSVKTSLIVLRNGKANDDIFMPSYDNNYNLLIDNYLKHKGEIYVSKDKIENRLDRNYYVSVKIVLEKLKNKEVKKLSEIAEIIKGHNINNNLLKNSGRYIVFNKKDNKGNQLFTDEIQNNSCLLKPNDIILPLIVSKRELLIFTENENETVINENYAIIRSSQNNYIRTYLQTKDGQDFLYQQTHANAAGSVLFRITISNLFNVLIPILPLSELNFIDDNWLKTNSLEKIHQLDKQLKSLITIYESGSLHYNLLLEIHSKINSNSQKLNTIEKQIESVIFNFETFSENFNTFKKHNIEKLNELNDKFVLDNQDKTRNYFSDIEKSLPDYNKLHSSAKTFEYLATGEYLLEQITKEKNIDFSPCILQFCRAIEGELYHQIFKPFKNELNRQFNKKQLDEIFENSQFRIKTIDNFKNSNKIQPHSLIIGLNEYFMLSLMYNSLTILTVPEFEKIKIYKLFNDFLVKKLNNKESILNSKFIGELKEIAKIRNDVAHTYAEIIDEKQSIRIRNKIYKILNNWLVVLK